MRNLEVKVLSTENFLIHLHVFKILFFCFISSVFSSCRQKGHHAKPYFHQSVSEASNGIIYHILLFIKDQMILNSQMNVLSKILFTLPQRKHHSVIDPLWLLIIQRIEFQMLCPIMHERNNNYF